MLPYADGRSAGWPLVTYERNGGVTIVVPTRRSLVRAVMAVTFADLFGFLFAPAAAIAYLLFATRRPRAILRIADGTFSIVETDDNGVGRLVKRREWPADQIGEMRPNRYENGLYVVIRGRDSFNLLPDLPPDHLQLIYSELDATRQRLVSGQG